MSTLHIYQSNVGSKLILRSPLVQLAEQWRDRSASTEPIVLMTHSRVEELDATARHYLLAPYESEAAESLLAFIVQRGGEIAANGRLRGVTVTGMHFTLPWLPSENPESVGEPSDRSGVLEIVEFPAQEERYIHVDSQIVQAVARWKLDCSFTGPVLLWSVVDTDDEPAHRSTRLLWPTDERHVAQLLTRLEQEKNLPIYLSPVPNPGSYADPWGKVDTLSCKLPGDKSSQRESAYAQVRVAKTSTEEPDSASAPPVEAKPPSKLKSIFHRKKK